MHSSCRVVQRCVSCLVRCLFVVPPVQLIRFRRSLNIDCKDSTITTNHSSKQPRHKHNSAMVQTSAQCDVYRQLPVPPVMRHLPNNGDLGHDGCRSRFTCLRATDSDANEVRSHAPLCRGGTSIRKNLYLPRRVFHLLGVLNTTSE